MIEKLPALGNFDANNFKIRKNRSLGKGAFGEVYACSFGYGDKLQCVLKVAKKYGEEDLMLEGRILKKIFDDSFDERQKLFPFVFGYNVKAKGLVCERFFGFSIKQHAVSRAKNDWVKRLIEVSNAIEFLRSKGVLHLDIHSRNVLASEETSKLIDFGKATLVAFPITYNLDSSERKIYNERHTQIEYELRNEKNSTTKECSDVYSLGALIVYIARNCVLADRLCARFLDLGASCCAPRSKISSLTLLKRDLEELLE